MNDRQKKFCHEYIKDLNATQAAKRAGYSKRTAGAKGPELLKNVEIQKVSELQQKAAWEKAGIDAERVLKELENLAVYDPRNVTNGTQRALGSRTPRS